MQKIAIISDIHGNLPALESVLKDIKKRSIEKVICLGDLVGKGPNSLEVIDICKEKCDTIIAGNWDKYLANNDKAGDVSWYRQQIGKQRLNYLRDLPEAIGFYISGRYLRLFHAHPHNVFKRILKNSSIEEKEEMFDIPRIKSIETDNIKADMVGYGDIHSTFIETMSKGKILFNVGSVGNPCDYITMASYVIMEGELNDKIRSNFSIQFQRVSYNIELSIEHARKTNLPKMESYIRELKTAVYSR